jgi:putative transcriptional regulator
MGRGCGEAQPQQPRRSRTPRLVRSTRQKSVITMKRRACGLKQDCLRAPGNAHCFSGQTMPTKPKSLKGQLLLDNGRLQGSFFHRGVILVCQHDADGAFGLVLNRTTGKSVGEALVAKLPETLKQQGLFLGGPVQPQALSFLHNDSYIPEANVIPNLSLEHSLDTLIEVSDSYSPTRQLKVFAGYAGWSPGQLDDEMKRDTWLTHPASVDLVFYPQPGELWKLILAEKGWKYRLLADAPDDLSWN